MFPTRDTQTTLAFAWESAMASAGQIKKRSQSTRDFLAANTASANVFLDLSEWLRLQVVLLNKAKAVTGVLAYARDQLNDQTRDVTTEFNDLTAAVDAVIAWIVANMPTAASGRLDLETLNADGSRSVRTFTPAQSAGILPLLDTLIASIE